MRIILATGIYPPQIGGPATYVRALAEELATEHEIIVLTYRGKGDVLRGKGWNVESVSRSIPILRWFWYAQKLKEVGKDADVVYCFSSISCGIPLILSRLKKPKKVLRLGGDFGWERYTDFGGTKSLRDFYVDRCWLLVVRVMQRILSTFDHIVFSTEFQQKIYSDAYKKLPSHSVIENACITKSQQPTTNNQQPHIPFRLLFLGRFVNFKCIPRLIEAVKELPDVTLTIVGSGPCEAALHRLVDSLDLGSRVRFVSSVSGKDKEEIFAKHDLLVMPSLTDISPNTALEARAHGLPVLLTQETGIAADGIVTADLSTPQKITQEITRVRDGYSFVAEAASKEIFGRSWEEVSTETADLFATL